MKFKLDENLSPTLASAFISAGHEAHSALEQTLGGSVDPRLIEVCRLEGRALVTLDLDFANIHRYPPRSVRPGSWSSGSVHRLTELSPLHWRTRSRCCSGRR